MKKKEFKASDIILITEGVVLLLISVACILIEYINR